MSKWNGHIGFAVNGEVEPGLWVDEVVEKAYKGEMLSDRWRVPVELTTISTYQIL